MTDRERLLQTLVAVYAYYDRELSEFAISVWLEDLEEHPVDAVCEAFKRHRRDPERGQWLPKSADILRQLQGDKAEAVQMAWTRLLLQVRTLLRGQDSQASVGSGFVVSEEGHLITNYHVVSQFALQPTRYRLVYATVDGRQGALELLAFDVLHDLALLKAGDTPARRFDALPLRPPTRSRAAGSAPARRRGGERRARAPSSARPARDAALQRWAPSSWTSCSSWSARLTS